MDKKIYKKIEYIEAIEEWLEKQGRNCIIPKLRTANRKSLISMVEDYLYIDMVGFVERRNKRFTTIFINGYKMKLETIYKN